jgi:hypothetical protein
LDGVAANECQHYYWCNNKATLITDLIKCIEGLLFDSSEGNCKDSSEVQCNTITNADSDEMESSSVTREKEISPEMGQWLHAKTLTFLDHCPDTSLGWQKN